MMKKLFILSICCAFTSMAIAQKSNLALGLRMTPDGAGFTGKYFLDRNVAFEGQLNAGGIFGLEGSSVSFVGLLEYHVSFPDPSWRLYFGGGLHAGVWTHDRGHRNAEGRFDDHHSDPIFGMDGIGGVEYLFKSIPVGLSADFKPAINFVSEVDFFPHNLFGVSARYYLHR